MVGERIEVKYSKVFPIEYLSSGSKSYSHRFVILAYLLGLNLKIYNFSISEDAFYTLKALYDEFHLYKIDGQNILTLSSKHRVCREKIQVGESGSTLRFLIPVMLDGKEHTFYGKSSLFKRPLDYYFKLFDEEGIDYKLGNDFLYIKGKLKNDYYRVASKLSSQFASAMMMASINKFEVDVKAETSKQYILQTMDAIKIIKSKYLSANKEAKLRVVPDMSNRALFSALDYFGQLKTKMPLELGRASADSIFEKWIERDQTKYNVKNNIDLAPVLAGFLSIKSDFTGKIYEIYGLGNLIYKESNRLYEIKRVLNLFGRYVSIKKDRILVGGKKSQASSLEVSVSDHRICHLALLLSSVYDGEVIINNIDVLKKSHIELYNYLKRRVK